MKNPDAGGMSPRAYKKRKSGPAAYNYDYLGKRTEVYDPSVGGTYEYFNGATRDSYKGGTHWSIDGGVFTYEVGSYDYGVYFGRSDHLGTPKITTNTSGTVIKTESMGPFGDGFTATGASISDIGFAGGDYDRSGDSNNFGARDYKPIEGRWLSPDPAGLAAVDPSNPQTWNRYAYVLNNPLSFTDPTGLDCVYMNEDETVNHLTVGDNCDSPTDNGYFFDGTVDQSTVFMNANGDVMAQVNGALDFTCSGECPGDSITVNGGPPLQADFAGSLPGQIAATNKGCGVSATSLNNYLGTKSSPMVGQGTNLMNSGAQYNLDPRLFVSVAGAETRFGNNITAGQFNAFNVLYNGHNSPFASFQSAINSVGYSLTNPRNGYDLSNTSTMYKTYCSTGSTCAAGLNNVNTFMRQQGANPTSLHYPCKKD